MHNPYHLYEFSKTTFEKLAPRSGFEIAHHDYSVCQTFLPPVFDKVLKPYMKMTNTGMEINVWLRKI